MENILFIVFDVSSSDLFLHNIVVHSFYIDA